MSKVRYEDYVDEMDNDDEVHFQKNQKKRHNEQYKEYTGRKSKSKNRFKNMRGHKSDYDD